jgi:P-type conjugative transfer protein TrbJ
MKKAFAVLLILSLSVLLNAPAVFAGGGGMTGGALETTQLLNKAELVKQVAEAVKQTQELILQYENMLQNTLQLPMSIWNDVTGAMSELQNLLNSAKSLTFGAALDFEKFTKQHPGFRTSLEDGMDFSKEYKKRIGNWQEYQEGVLKANQIAVEDVKDNAALIKRLHEASKSSVGQMQALQAGNQIAAFMAQELDALRLDMARQIDLHSEWAQNEQQERTDETAAFEKALGTVEKNTRYKERPR